MQKIIYASIHSFAIAIATISLLNLPTFLSATKGSGSLMSYIMLGFSVILFFYLFFKKRYDVNNLLTLLILSILSYLVVGLTTKFIWEESELTSRGSGPVEDWTYIVRLMLQSLFVMLASYKYTLFCHSREQMNKYLNILIVIALVGSLITIFSPFLGFYQSGFFIDSTVNSGGLTRPAGLYMNPNPAGFHAVSTLLLVISLLFRTKTSRILVFLLIIISLISAFITLSKGAILMSLIVIFSYMFFGIAFYRKLLSTSRKSFLIIGSLIIFSFIQFITFLIAQFSQLGEFEQIRLKQIVDLLGGKVNAETTTTRTDLASIGLEWISESPILGWGFGAFHYFREGSAGVHNMFLMLIGESGFVPLLLYISFFLFGIYKSIRLKNMEYRFICLTFFLFTLFFANGNHNLFDNYEIGFLFGFICALIKIDAIERREEEEYEQEKTI
jgi:O-antigen ligase